MKSESQNATTSTTDIRSQTSTPKARAIVHPRPTGSLRLRPTAFDDREQDGPVDGISSGTSEKPRHVS